DPREGQEKKWGKLNRDPNYAPATFWLCARDAGYTGKMPLTKKDEEKASILDLLANLPKWRSKEDRAFVTVGTRHHIEVRSLAFDEWLRRHALQEQGLPLSAECVHLVKETVAA